MWDPKKAEGIKVPTSRVDWANWQDSSNFHFELDGYGVGWRGTDRIPQAVISDLVGKGNKIAKILGKKGKFLLFDNSIMHRATVAKKRYRDAIVFQFKPTVEKIEPALHKDYTGNGWTHTTFNADPRILEALKRTPENAHEVQLAAMREEAR